MCNVGIKAVDAFCTDVLKCFLSYYTLIIAPICEFSVLVDVLRSMLGFCEFSVLVDVPWSVLLLCEFYVLVDVPDLWTDFLSFPYWSMFPDLCTEFMSFLLYVSSDPCSDFLYFMWRCTLIHAPMSNSVPIDLIKTPILCAFCRDAPDLYVLCTNAPNHGPILRALYTNALIFCVFCSDALYPCHDFVCFFFRTGVPLLMLWFFVFSVPIHLTMVHICVLCFVFFSHHLL